MNSALARLRAKTDHDLGILVAKQLNRSRSLANSGAYCEAAKTYIAARALLKVANLPTAERARLDRLSQDVRQTVELPVGAVA